MLESNRFLLPFWNIGQSDKSPPLCCLYTYGMQDTDKALWTFTYDFRVTTEYLVIIIFKKEKWFICVLNSYVLSRPIWLETEMSEEPPHQGELFKCLNWLTGKQASIKVFVWHEISFDSTIWLTLRPVSIKVFVWHENKLWFK